MTYQKVTYKIDCQEEAFGPRGRRKVTGYLPVPQPIDGVKMAVDQRDGWWQVSEYWSGMAITGASTRKLAIEVAIRTVEARAVEIPYLIQHNLVKHGFANHA